MKNIEKAFTFQFNDAKWVNKFIIGSLMAVASFFIIPLPILVGYLLQLVKNVITQKPVVMPEWKNFGKLFINGFKFIIGSAVYMIPVFLIIFLMIKKNLSKK